MPEMDRSSRSDSSSEATVRRIRADEWKSYREIRLRSLQSDPLAFGSTYARELAYEDSLWMDRVDKAATSQTQAMWIALGGGNLLGTSGVFGHDSVFHLYGVWVDPAWRGKHIGSRLVDAALGWITTNHPDSPIKLDVNPSAGTAMRLYLSRGFELTGEEEPLSHTPGEIVKSMILRRKS